MEEIEVKYIELECNPLTHVYLSNQWINEDSNRDSSDTLEQVLEVTHHGLSQKFIRVALDKGENQGLIENRSVLVTLSGEYIKQTE